MSGLRAEVQGNEGAVPLIGRGEYHLERRLTGRALSLRIGLRPRSMRLDGCADLRNFLEKWRETIKSMPSKPNGGSLSQTQGIGEQIGYCVMMLFPMEMVLKGD